MAFTGAYNASDIGTVIIDLAGNVLVAFVAFAALIGIVLVWRFWKHNSK